MYKKETLEKRYNKFVGKKFNENQIVEYTRELFKDTKLKDIDELEIGYELGNKSYNEHVFCAYTKFTRDIKLQVSMFVNEKLKVERTHVIMYMLKGELK